MLRMSMAEAAREAAVDRTAAALFRFSNANDNMLGIVVMWEMVNYC